VSSDHPFEEALASGLPRVWVAGDEARADLVAELAPSGFPVVLGEADDPLPDSVRVVLGTPGSVAAAVSARPGLVGVAVAGAGEPCVGTPGVDLVMRRPVDGAALRLLVSHLVGPGYERRLGRRVALDVRVRLLAGLRPRSARLVELSPGGALVRCAGNVRVGGPVALWLPAGLGAAFPCLLPARALRVRSEPSGEQWVSLAFTWLSLAAQSRLRRLLRAYDDTPGWRSEPEAPAERRGDTRHAYPRRVIGHGSLRPLVLIGRDLSFGGMRVDPSPELPLGSGLQVALHVRAGTTPLVLRARVQRDDGERGLFLRFEDVSAAQRDYLDGMLALLPAVDAEGRGVVVSQLVDEDEAVA
jgi:hypothetical protein